MSAFAGFNITPNYLRQFPKLPAGFINSTAERIYTTGYAEWAETTYQPIGVGVMETGIVGDLPKVALPNNTIGQKFFGILIHDSTYYVFPNQPQLTIHGQQPVIILRQCWDVRVWADSAVNTSDPVYLIHTAATGEQVGHFKNNNTGNNAVQVPARWIENLTVGAQPQAASIELFLPTTRVM